MDYEKKYNQALERAKKLQENSNGMILKKWLVSVFPELAESEDERIRKAFCKDIWTFIPNERAHKYIKWLEKQATVEHFELKKGHWYMCHRAYCCRADNLTVKEGERFQCEKDGIVKGFVIKDPEKYFIEVHAPAPMEDYQNDEVRRRSTIQVLEYAKSLDAYNQYGKEDIDKDIAWLEKQKDINALVQEASEKAYTEGMRVERKHWLEKQGESTLIEEIKRRKELYSQEKEKAVSSTEKLSLGGRIAVLEELLVFANEKQGQQKPILDFKASNWYVSKVDGKIHDLTYNPTDKTEPTFKVGDWIVTDKNSVVRIKSIDSNYYVLENTMRFTIDYVDKCWHLWTIANAKDGDVLVNGSNIFIFHFINETRLMGYCHVNTDDGKFYDDVGKNECFCLIDAVVNPATKEQRDLLFKKMKEAGYEWDAENRELNKIEQKPAWSEDDERMLHTIIADFKGFIRYNTSTLEPHFNECIAWLKFLKDRVQPQNLTVTDEELAQAKKNAYNDALDKIEYRSGEPTFDDGWSAAIWYLKKRNTMPKSQWKPSEEQMHDLRLAIDSFTFEPDYLQELYEDLKKLAE